MKRCKVLFFLLSVVIALFLSTANAHAYLLTVDPTYGGSVSSLPTGINNCSYYPCSANFTNYSVVQLTATPDSGYGLVDWSGDCLGTGITIYVFMNSPKSCTADFAYCDFSFTPADRTIPEAADSYSVAVSTNPPNCAWTANSEDSWITITSGSGTGAGLIHYTVSANTDRVRQGEIYISGSESPPSFQITQEGPGSGYILNPANGHYYQRYDRLMNWQDAKTFCEGRGAYLATITDDPEQQFVFNTFVTGGGPEDFRQCWLGGFQPPSAPEIYPYLDWQWVTGETWSYTHWCNVTPCYPYQPDDYITPWDQDSLAMYGDIIFNGMWHDTNEANLKSFICEWTELQYELNVTKTWTGYGTVRSSEYPTPPYINCCSGECGPVCSAFYSPNTPVILNAIPDADSTFIGWSGACEGTGSCYVSMDNDKDVTAFFNLRQYTVYTQTNQGGSIYPQSDVVNHGDYTQFNITVNPGFYIASATGCGGSRDGNTYYTGPITADCTVTVNFAPYTYTVSTAVIPQAGGSINPPSATVNHNATTQFTVTASPGYHIASVTGCGGTLSVNTYTTGPITGACTVTATFEINTYKVAASAGAGGGIIPSGQITVNHGSTPAFTVNPDTGYHIKSVNGTCGGALNGNTYTTSPVTGDCTVHAEFEINEYTVSTSVVGQGGGIDPTSAKVKHGNTAQFTITPDTGYHIASVSGCEGTVLESALKAIAKKKKKKGKVKALSSSTYTTGPITGACTVTATFEINAYKVTADAGPGGNIDPSGQITVNHGSTPAFTVNPDTGYHIKSVNGTCGGALNGNTYTTSPVTGDCTVHAEFEINEYTVSTSVVGQGGGIDPTSAKVKHGNTAQFTVTPDTGYHIVSVSGCDGTLSQSSIKGAAKKKKKGKVKALSSSTYKTGPITGACTVTATFEINAYKVTADAGPGGNIDPSGQITVNHGSTPAFTVNPDTGYHIKSVNGTCGGSLIDSAYTTNPVTGDCTVHAEFEINEYIVSTSAGQGGGIDPASAKVTHGNTAQFTIKPDTGFQILSVSGCGGTLNGFAYTTGEITANCTVTAAFEIATYTVSILKSGSGSGSIIAQGLICEGNACSGEYVHGTKIMFKVQPDAGFRVADVKIDGISIGAMNAFTFKKMTGSHSIEIIFAPL